MSFPFLDKLIAVARVLAWLGGAVVLAAIMYGLLQGWEWLFGGAP